MDEPTAGLDRGEQEQLGKVIALLKGQNKTVIVITHDLDFAAEHLERFVLLRNGSVVLDASAQSFFSHKELLETSGLVAPQLVRLSAAINRTPYALNVESFLQNIN